ncbi:MAG TPA: hypothetical protein VJZ25_01550 [Gemmatimonadaceae bacterium]|nr:hypothetical protein [Gemmatimonadaceae bacterium]
MRHRFGRRIAVGGACVAVAVGIPTVALAIRVANAPSPAASPIQGIGLVTSSQERGLDPRTAATLRMLNDRGLGAAALGKRLLTEARTVSTRISGKRLYLVPTETGKLCLFLEESGEACSEPLSQANPAQVVVEDRDGPGGVGPTVFGVAIDGVRSVTFAADGDRHVVPVTGNAFVFRGNSEMSAGSVLAVSATLDDGRVLSLR